MLDLWRPYAGHHVGVGQHVVGRHDEPAAFLDRVAGLADDPHCTGLHLLCQRRRLSLGRALDRSRRSGRKPFEHLREAESVQELANFGQDRRRPRKGAVQSSDDGGAPDLGGKRGEGAVREVPSQEPHRHQDREPGHDGTGEGIHLSEDRAPRRDPDPGPDGPADPVSHRCQDHERKRSLGERGGCSAHDPWGDKRSREQPGQQAQIGGQLERRAAPESVRRRKQDDDDDHHVQQIHWVMVTCPLDSVG